MTDETPPRIPYWRLWTDEEEVSHQTRCELPEFQMKAMGGGAAPQWPGNKTSGEMDVMVTVQPVGRVGQWHEDPATRWIIPLPGRWFVVSMDGTRIELGAGEISFGEDQNTRESDGRKGHRSGTVGDQPAVLMVVQFADPPTVNRPCRSR